MKVKNPKTKLLLQYLATGGIITIASITNPQFPYFLLKAYLKNHKFHKKIFLQDLKRLQKRELIDYNQLAGGGVKIILKKDGKKLALQYELDDMKLEKSKVWDGKWRLIIFDIPKTKKPASNAFVLKLKNLGFYRLQKSVYIHPFPCEKEIEFIAAIFNIRDHILIMHLPNFEGDDKIKNHFKI